MMPRKQPITDIYLKPSDVQKLTRGYVVHKIANKHKHCIQVVTVANAMQRKIDKLEKKIRELKAVSMVETTKTKRPYVKRNMEHWAKGGNKQYLKPFAKGIQNG